MTFSEEHKKHLSESLKGNKNRRGKKQSAEEIAKRVSTRLKNGKRMSLEAKQKMRVKRLSNPNMYWVGKHRNKETRLKISNSLRGRFGGENSPTWQGGKSFEPYSLEFNEDLREVIRNRDKRKCQICEMTELENGFKLDCHHIDYNKKNNNPNNLIAPCHRCHTKTNTKRDFWVKYFNRSNG